MSESILTPELITVISTLLSFVVGIVLRQPQFQKVKTAFSHSREFVTQIDDALYDDKITEEEFRKIFDAGKKIVDRGFEK